MTNLSQSRIVVIRDLCVRLVLKKSCMEFETSATPKSFTNFSAIYNTSSSPSSMIPLLAAVAVGTAGGLLVHHLSFFKITFINECSTNIDLHTHFSNFVNVPKDEIEIIVPGISIVKTIRRDYKSSFRNGSSNAATILEVSTDNFFRKISYNLNIIPPNLNPGFELCKTLDECKQNSKSGIGFNTPIQITPLSNTNGQNCRELMCLADGCEDDKKKHSCPYNTNFRVTFCPSSDKTRQETVTPQTMEDLNVSKHGYSDGVVSVVTKTDDSPAPTADTPALKADTSVTTVNGTEALPTPDASSKSKHCV